MQTRKLFIGVLLVLLCGANCSSIMAQTKRRPLPDWIFEKPKPSNRTFYYLIEKGVGETETEARNNAYTQAFMQVALKLGIPLNTEDISEAIASGSNIRMLSQRFTIPLNVVCYISRKNENESGWNYWLLCQVPEIGHADDARFDDFNDCYKFSKYEERQAKQAAIEKEKVQKSNARAITASAFIPGVGQMMKGHVGAGVGFLGGEIALFGGGTVCYFMSQNQQKIIQSTGISYEQYQAAVNTKNICDISMYVCYGLGAALHITNMVHAYLVPDKKLQSAGLTLAPTIIPTNEFSSPVYAMGVGVQYKF